MTVDLADETTDALMLKLARHWVRRIHLLPIHLYHFTDASGLIGDFAISVSVAFDGQ